MFPNKSITHEYKIFLYIIMFFRIVLYICNSISFIKMECNYESYHINILMQTYATVEISYDAYKHAYNHFLKKKNTYKKMKKNSSHPAFPIYIRSLQQVLTSVCTAISSFIFCCAYQKSISHSLPLFCLLPSSVGSKNSSRARNR